MKVVFVGPTLGEERHRIAVPGVEIRGPAGQGDLARAVLQGATVIGLIDGVFEQTAAVWHKEILFALSEGVQVFGAASMGALRATECAPFGMIGVGEVFRRYAEGEIVDDDAVGQVHGPEELDYMPLSEPLVNIEATTRSLMEKGLITVSEGAEIDRAGRDLFFKERNWGRVLAAATLIEDERRAEIAATIRRYRRDIKREDALLLIERVGQAADARVAPPEHWRFSETQMWRNLIESLRETTGPRTGEWRPSGESSTPESRPPL